MHCDSAKCSEFQNEEFQQVQVDGQTVSLNLGKCSSSNQGCAKMD